MPSNWFIVKPDRELVPYTSTQMKMKQLAASGQLKTGDLVRRAEQGTPVAAGKVQGLFPHDQPTARPRTTPPPLPSERSESGMQELSETPTLSSNETSERQRRTPPPLPSERTESGTASSPGPPPLPPSKEEQAKAVYIRVADRNNS